MAYVRDVHHPLHGIAQIPQALFQHILHDIGAQVADVGIVIHRGAAGVHLHMAGGVGDEFSFFVGGGIV